MNPVTIRKATSADIRVLRRFEQGVIDTERPLDSTLRRDPDTRYYDIEFMLTAPHIYLIVAEQEGLVIGSGYARIEDSKPYAQHRKHAYLGFMFVEPDQRGKGINKMIIDELTRWAKEQAITELRLDVYNGNDPAIAAYEKIGFSKNLINMRKGI